MDFLFEKYDKFFLKVLFWIFKVSLVDFKDYYDSFLSVILGTNVC